jgi:CrcB protein
MTGPGSLGRDDLPVDSDLDVNDTTIGYSRPIHLRWRYLALVAVGGTVGTAIREGLTLVVPAVGGVTWIILGINVIGAFALGVLLESFARRGPDEGRRRNLRLLLGTGVLGGFTTYSSLATATALLLVSGETVLALVYALSTVLLGAAGAAAGIVLASALHRRSVHRRTGSNGSAR